MKARLVIVFVLALGVTLLLAWTVAATEAKMNAEAQTFPYIGSAHRVELYAEYLDAANVGYTSDITFTPAFTTYLPIVFRSCSPGICGSVTLNGAPAAGVFLELRFYNGSTWSTRATINTGADGSYSFLSAPSLAPGQQYYVRFLNPATTADGRLADWFTPFITSYTAGSTVPLGVFDIADVPLVSPPSGATISLPHLFQWMRRTATPTDIYEFDLWDPSSNAFFYSHPPLGYASGYTLNSLPAGFSVGTPCWWYVSVYAQDGSYGESFYYYKVTFSNAGLGARTASQSAPHKPMRIVQDRHAR